MMDTGEEYEFDYGNEIGIKASTKSRAVYEVLRLDKEGQNRRIYVKRRDLLRTHGLKPRDLRRIDPFWEKPEATHSIVIKDSSFLVSLLGVRCLVTEERALVFDPENEAARKFLAIVTPRLRTAAGTSIISDLRRQSMDTLTNGTSIDADHHNLMVTPFELEVLEGVLTVTVSQLDNQLSSLMKHASKVLSAVPSEVNPMNLEQLRKTKQSCVELEAKSDALR